MKKFEDIGARLRQLRGPKTQSDFARKLNISLPAWQNYEAGKRIPKGDILYRIASITGYPVDWILSGEQKKELTDEEVKEQIRHDLWIEKTTYTELDIEQMVPAYRDSLKEQALKVAETQASYEYGSITYKIVKLLAGMSEEEKSTVLKYVETQKHLIEELKKAEKTESDLQHLHEKRPRPVPIDFSALERYALRLYELAEEKGVAYKLDEIMERLLNDLKEQSDQPKKEPLERSE